MPRSDRGAGVGCWAPARVSVIIEFDGLMIEVDDGWLERFNGSAALEAP